MCLLKERSERRGFVSLVFLGDKEADEDPGEDSVLKPIFTDGAS